MSGNVTALEGSHVTKKYRDRSIITHALGMRPGILTGCEVGGGRSKEGLSQGPSRVKPWLSSFYFSQAAFVSLERYGDWGLGCRVEGGGCREDCACVWPHACARCGVRGSARGYLTESVYKVVF